MSPGAASPARCKGGQDELAGLGLRSLGITGSRNVLRCHDADASIRSRSAEAGKDPVRILGVSLEDDEETQMNYLWRLRMLTLASIFGGIFCGYFIRTDGVWTAFLIDCGVAVLCLAFGAWRGYFSIFRVVDFVQFISVAIASRWLVTHGWAK